jgi:hypothetical protein
MTAYEKLSLVLLDHIALGMGQILNIAASLPHSNPEVMKYVTDWIKKACSYDDQVQKAVGPTTAFDHAE